MAEIRPFAGIRYATTHDSSDLIAPPYDVLDAASKAALLARSPHNFVEIDLPHLPPKSPGPDAAYAKAAATFTQWLASGVLRQDRRAALYPYAQTFEHDGHTYHRRGLICLVKLTPLGVDVIPHEQTYKGAIEDRLKLMHASEAQFSPIFGLFMDDSNRITDLAYSQAGRAEVDATLDGVRSQMWSIIDAELESQLIDAFESKKIYIADGHHRYNTALQYQFEAEQMHGGPLPASHPANYCMFVLVNALDSGLLVLPTHRLIGNLGAFDAAAFLNKVSTVFDVSAVDTTIDDFASSLSSGTLGIYIGSDRSLHRLVLRDKSVLAALSPDKSMAWQTLDVAIVQRYLLEEVLAPLANGELTKAYTPEATEVVRLVDGQSLQVGVLLAPTPVHALEELGKSGEVMPQKSTYFFPKLASGMVSYSVTTS